MFRGLTMGLFAIGTIACNGTDGPTDQDTDTEAAVALSWPRLDCDPLVPEFCGYPFPSNVYTVSDAGTPTGRRVAFEEGLLQGNDSDPWDDADGFSASTRMLTMIPGATGAELASAANLTESLDEDAATLILDVETGEPVLHFAEMDARAPSDDERSLVIHPAERLRDNARYIVAIRSLTDASGSVIAPSPVFAALRDGTESEEASVDSRRELYEDIFGHLEAAGWARSDIQSAWDFSTASDENNTRWLLHMRDEGMALVDADPSYTITSVDSELDPDNIAFRIQGTLQVPLYMTLDGAGSLLLFGDDGLPEINAETPWAEVPFEVLIPNSALTEPAALVQYGHGLFGSFDQIESSHLRSFINEYNYVMFGVDLQGMAAIDAQAVGLELTFGDFDGARTMWDRLHQGFLNSLAAMRIMKTAFAEDATYGSYIKGDEAYYYGISQGGISGSVYLALSKDVTRGALGVTGQPYSLLLFRSVDFTPFLDIMAETWPDLRQQQLLVALTQMPWDRVEPGGFTHHVLDNRFPDTPAKEVLMRVAIGDHQVPTLGAHLMARTFGAKHLTSGLRDLPGLEAVTSTESGSFLVEYDFGLPAVPDCGVPMDLCEDPHGKVRRLDEARQQLDEFFRTGRGTNFCPDGVCRFPDLSGCEAGEDAAASAALCEF